MGERLGHAQHEVGLANLTAFGEIGQSRIVGGITFRHPLLDPSADQCLLVVRQKPLTAKRAVVVVRGPWGHVVGLGDVLDERTQRRHFLVRREGHGANFTLSMALSAMGVNEWRNVFVKGHSLCIGRPSKKESGSHQMGQLEIVRHETKV